jgi:hypothetical protein
MTEKSKPVLKRRESAKTNVGVLINKELWKKFKIRCIEIEESPGDVLSQLITDYLKK